MTTGRATHKVTAPNTAYNGESAGVQFANGVGYTDDTTQLDWFDRHGYTVEEIAGLGPAPPNPIFELVPDLTLEDLSSSRLRQICDNLGLEHEGLDKAEVIALIERGTEPPA